MFDLSIPYRVQPPLFSKRETYMNGNSKVDVMATKEGFVSNYKFHDGSTKWYFVVQKAREVTQFWHGVLQFVQLSLFVLHSFWRVRVALVRR